MGDVSPAPAPQTQKETNQRIEEQDGWCSSGPRPSSWILEATSPAKDLTPGTGQVKEGGCGPPALSVPLGTLKRDRHTRGPPEGQS